MLPRNLVFWIRLFDDLLGSVLGLHRKREEPLAGLARLLPSTDPEFLAVHVQGAGEIRMRFLLLAFVVEQGATVCVIVFFAHRFALFWVLLRAIVFATLTKVSGVVFSMPSDQAFICWQSCRQAGDFRKVAPCCHSAMSSRMIETNLGWNVTGSTMPACMPRTASWTATLMISR